MAEPTVLQAVRQQQKALLAREAEQMKEMAKVWARAEAELQSSMDALALQIQAMRDAGQVVNPGKLYRMGRFQRLLFEVRREAEGYADYAAETVTAAQRQNAWIAEQEAASLLQVKPGAVEAMVGMMGDGTPLRQYLAGVYGDAARGMTDHLVRAVIQGLNPRQTARAMAKGLNLGLDRALTIARTEQLRVYREARRLTYMDSNVVQFYRRVSAKQDRTCVGCLLADGQVYPKSEPFEDHVNGRCTDVPIVEGYMPQWETGQQWLEKQDPVTQQKIMGPGRYELWKSGAVRLEDMKEHRYDPIWGGSWVPTPIKHLVDQSAAAAAG